MGELTIRDYKKEDRAKIIELSQKGLDKNFSVKRWNWLHHNKRTKGSSVVVVLHEGQIVGSFGLIRKTFAYRGDTFIGGRLVDPVVDSSMRGRGLFSKMIRALRERSADVAFEYLFPNALSYPGFLKAGYCSIGPIPQPYCQLKFFGEPVKEKLRYVATGMRIPRRGKLTVTSGSVGELKEATPVTPFDKFGLVRDYNYLKWRYDESPMKTYDILIARDSHRVQSACVIHRNGQLLNIVDFITYGDPLVLPDYIATIRELYGKVTINLWDNSIDGIGRYFIGDVRQYLGQKNGHNFMVLERNRKMPDEFFNRLHWYVTEGDVEAN